MEKTAKQEAIRKAYGEYWEQLSSQAKKCALEHNGYISPIISGIGNIPREFVTFNDLGFRPRTIVGIEHNNGWIRIENEEDLPKEDKVECHLIINNGSMELHGGFRRYSKETFYFFNTKGEGFLIDSVSHWQPIVKPEKPIY